MRLQLCVLAVVASILVVNGRSTPVLEKPSSSDTTSQYLFVDAATKDWWETASLYQIYPRSFKDSDGDGIGDLNGIRSKLPYLKSLGITACWLSPIFLSPMKDFGYDIQDFFSIQPEYGTMDDFDALVAEAKVQGIKIILDFVPNHSSDKNEWFIKSVNRVSGFEDFYVWNPGYLDSNGKRVPPNNWLSVFRGSAWEWNAQRQEYYYHAFAVQQPDLNYRNSAVVDMMKSVLRFWLDRGIAGFRVDAVPNMFEVGADSSGKIPDEPVSGYTNDTLDYGYLNHIYTQTQDETFDMVYQWRELLDQYLADKGGDTRVMLTESYVDITLQMKFYEDGNGRLGAHIPMNFYLLLNLNNYSTAADFKKYIDIWVDNMPAGRTANWVIGNHDQRRVGSRMGRDRIDMMNMIDLSLPGASITYNGEEIGMTDVWISWAETVDPQACNTDQNVYDAHSRDPARTPFQWDDSTSAGFSTNTKTWLPVSPDYRSNNVKNQENALRSHLKVYRDLIKMRQQNTFKYGDLETYSIMDDSVLVLVRRLDSIHDSFVVVANIGNQAKTVNLAKTRAFAGPMFYEVVGSSSRVRRGATVNPNAIHVLPDESYVLRIPAANNPKSRYLDIKDEH